jgi:hypothetical protein
MRFKRLAWFLTAGLVVGCSSDKKSSESGGGALEIGIFRSDLTPSAALQVVATVIGDVAESSGNALALEYGDLSLDGDDDDKVGTHPMCMKGDARPKKTLASEYSLDDAPNNPIAANIGKELSPMDPNYAAKQAYCSLVMPAAPVNNAPRMLGVFLCMLSEHLVDANLRAGKMEGIRSVDAGECETSDMGIPGDAYIIADLTYQRSTQAGWDKNLRLENMTLKAASGDVIQVWKDIHDVSYRINANGIAVKMFEDQGSETMDNAGGVTSFHLERGLNGQPSQIRVETVFDYRDATDEEIGMSGGIDRVRLYVTAEINEETGSLEEIYTYEGLVLFVGGHPSNFTRDGGMLSTVKGTMQDGLWVRGYHTDISNTSSRRGTFEHWLMPRDGGYCAMDSCADQTGLAYTAADRNFMLPRDGEFLTPWQQYEAITQPLRFTSVTFSDFADAE